MPYRLPEGKRCKRSDFKEIFDAVKDFTGYSIPDIGKVSGKGKNYLFANLYSKSDYREHMSWDTVEGVLMPFMFGTYFPPMEKMTRKETGEARWDDHPNYVDFAPTRESIRELREELGCSWPSLADYWGVTEGSMCDFYSNTDKKFISKKNASKWSSRVRKVRTLPDRIKSEKFPKERSNPNDGRFADKQGLIQVLRTAKGSGTWNELAEELDIETTGRRLSDYCSGRRNKGMRSELHDKLMESARRLLEKREHRAKGILVTQDKQYDQYRTGGTYTKRMLRDMKFEA